MHTEEELLNLLYLATKTMRSAQKKYFSQRLNANLESAKQAERDVDKVLAQLEIARTQGNLF